MSCRAGGKKINLSVLKEPSSLSTYKDTNLDYLFLFWVRLKKGLAHKPTTLLLFYVPSYFTNHFGVSITVQIVILKNRSPRKSKFVQQTGESEMGGGKVPVFGRTGPWG